MFFSSKPISYLQIATSKAILRFPLKIITVHNNFTATITLRVVTGTSNTHLAHSASESSESSVSFLDEVNRTINDQIFVPLSKACILQCIETFQVDKEKIKFTSLCICQVVKDVPARKKKGPRAQCRFFLFANEVVVMCFQNTC